MHTHERGLQTQALPHLSSLIFYLSAWLDCIITRNILTVFYEVFQSK